MKKMNSRQLKQPATYTVMRHLSVSLCLCAIIILFTACDDGEAPLPGSDAETVAANISPRMESDVSQTSPGYVAPHADTRATLLDTFHENDQILVTYHNGLAERTATFTRMADRRWTTGTANEETIHINTLGNTTVKATFVQTGTEPTTDPATGITTYTDLLTEATADFTNGTIATETARADYIIILTFGHARALLVTPATITTTGTGTAGNTSLTIDTGKPVYFDITTADGVTQRLEATETRMDNPPEQVAPAAIAPAGATLQAITFTLVGETTPRRAIPDIPLTLVAGKQYTPAITANRVNGYSFTVSEADGTIAPWTDGGTATHTYTHTIDSYQALAAFATEMNELNTLNGDGATAGISALQTANITIPNNGTGNNWTPIERFQGLYNGNGYTITGIKVTGDGTDKNTGFFRQLAIGAEIVNVHLRQGAVTNNYTGDGPSYNGILAGYIDGTNIALCSATGTVTGGYNCGGLVGIVSSTHITRSRAHCTVTTSAENAITGVLIGQVSNSTIVACMADGSVTAIGPSSISGGLIGAISSSGTPKVYYCYATATATGDSYTGTLVGYNFDTAATAIQYCYSNTPGSLLGMGNYNTDTCWQNYIGSTGTPAAIVRAGSITDVYTWTGIVFEPVSFTGSKVWTTANDFSTLNYYTY